MTMKQLGLINRDDTILVMIDIQEKFTSVISEIDTVIENTNILLKAAEILKIPILMTEQYPKGLGSTTTRIHVPAEVESRKIEKLAFSCFDSEDFVACLQELGRKTIVLCGIETHICILKTALHGLKEGYQVHVVADATSSRELQDKSLSIARMRQSGVFIVTTEMLLFQLLKVAGTDTFRRIYELIK